MDSKSTLTRYISITKLSAETTKPTKAKAVKDDQILPQLQVTPDGLTSFLPLSTSLQLKNKRKMLYFSMDFGELNFDGLIDTGALSTAFPEDDTRKFRLLAPHTILNEGLPPEFQITVANGQLEAPIATIELQFEVGDVTFGEKFIIKTNLTSPLTGDRSLIPTTQQYHTRYASRNLDLFLLFNANKKRRSDIPKCY